MIFRRDNRGEGFQRQLSHLRQQLEESESEVAVPDLGDEEAEAARRFEPITESSFAPPRTSFTQAERAESPLATTQAARAATGLDAAATVLSAHDYWEGTLRSEGSVTIRGRLQGQVHAARDVTIDEGADVQAEVYAHNVLIHGTVRGRVEASNRLEIYPTGQVIGDVKAPSLVVHEGAKLSGQLRMERSSEPGRVESAPSGTSRSQDRSS